MKKTLFNLFVKYLRSPWWAKLCVMVLLVAFIFGWYFTYTYVGYHREQVAHEKLSLSWPDFDLNQYTYNPQSGGPIGGSSFPTNVPQTYWDRIWQEWDNLKSRTRSFSLGKINENFHYIAHFKKLESLYIIDDSATTNNEFRHLVELKHLTKLIIFVNSISLEDCQTLARLSNLKQLEVTVITITPQQRNILESIPNCNLKILP